MAVSIHANNDRRTYVTAATRGGMSFDQLCRGEDPYYVCDRECLVDITHRDTLETAEKKLVEKIENLFLDLQIQKDVKINKFYIGKTYVPKSKSKKIKKLDEFNPKTWRKEGISSRWSDHRANDYGKDGMIVIAVITRTQVPRKRERNTENVTTKLNSELYTLALEQRLLHYYKITKGDDRLDNDTFTSGGTDKKGSAGYALYVAFSCIENTDVENNVESGILSSSFMDNNEEVITPPGTSPTSLPTLQTPTHINGSNTLPTALSCVEDVATTNCPSVNTATPINMHPTSAIHGEYSPTPIVPPSDLVSPSDPIPSSMSTPSSLQITPPTANITHDACVSPSQRPVLSHIQGSYIQGRSPGIEHHGSHDQLDQDQMDSSQSNEDDNDIEFIGYSNVSGNSSHYTSTPTKTGTSYGSKSSLANTRKRKRLSLSRKNMKRKNLYQQMPHN